MSEVKTGIEFLDSFFNEIKTNKTLDPEITELLSKLYNENKLSDKNIQNSLDLVRKRKLNENKEPKP